MLIRNEVMAQHRTRSRAALRVAVPGTPVAARGLHGRWPACRSAMHDRLDAGRRDAAHPNSVNKP